MSKAQSYWLELTGELGVSREVSRKWWQFLKASYSSPGRHYHTMRHVTNFLDAMHRHGKPDAIMKVSAFFHDAVYDSSSHENESKSVEIAKQFLSETNLSEQFVSEVAVYIMATQKHQISEGIDPARIALFLDCDLIVLAASPRRYSNYASAIRAEYCQYSDTDYRKGRTAVLESFLQRKNIFFTSDIQNLYEQRARSNLNRELSTLNK